MRCIVTAGPTIEPLDDVRRLTNFSTGSLGCQLSAYLTERKHDVTLLVSEQATCRGDRIASEVRQFSSTADLLSLIQALATPEVGAIFHAAAVSDFTFGKIWEADEAGTRNELSGGKVSSRSGKLLAELIPTPKIISQLRESFPNQLLFGWKYEVDGSQSDVLEKARRQLRESHSDYCIANGAAYGSGFGIVRTDEHVHAETREVLFQKLEELLSAQPD
ncbi:MAG: DNA/pantothenate metabolism flavoprotein domain protein [Verrucomicrobiales bacterium]|nr:DNA/pantothenate metabolism flavoprotein domain protein [Verrucomicrobiales bacterium]|tara:strand:+ start:546 stop:1202 length:657 start_codon:yes stop_codon:yes gene_type:complete